VPPTIRNLLRNTAYIGNYHGIEGYCEGIVDREIFSQVQQAINGRKTAKRSPSGRVYIFGSLLTCGECGRMMSGSFRAASIEGGIEYYYYRCEGFYRNRTCTHKRMFNEKYLESVLLENLESYIRDFFAEYNERNPTINQVRNERAKLERKLKRLTELYVDEYISKEEYRRDYNTYMTMMDQLAAVPEPEHVNIQALADLLETDFRSVYKGSSRGERRLFWRRIIRRISITNDNKIQQIFFA